jgi:predicted PurR-regulated permease PerM
MEEQEEQNQEEQNQENQKADVFQATERSSGPVFLDVSWASIVRIAFAASVIYLIYFIGNILIWLIFALIISILFNPAINFFHKLKIPRLLSAIFVYLSIFIILGVLVYAMAPLLFVEIQHFSDKLPEYFGQASPYLRGLKIEALEDFQTFSEEAERVLFRASSNIFMALGVFFGGIFTFLIMFTMAFFLSLEEKGIKEIIALISPVQYKEKVLKIWKKTEKNISTWFAIRILCCIFIGLATGITCYVLDIKYAVVFGILAGVTNLIVYIGPFLSTLFISLFILITASLPKAIIFAIAIYIAQQIENYILMPLLSKKFLKLSPALVLISLLVGAKLWGLPGAILAIPLVGIIFEFGKGVLEHRKEQKIKES